MGDVDRPARRCRGRRGKSLSLPGGGDDDRDNTLDEAETQDQLAEDDRKTRSRRELAGQHDNFEEISPDLGVLDDDALARSLAEHPDETLTLLADLTGATDEKLRGLARRVAGRIVVDVARAEPDRRRGIGRIRTLPMDDAGGDLDLDASLDALQLSQATGTVPATEELRVRSWARPDTAICLVIDRSGSMTGDRLAAAAVATAAAVQRAPDDVSVLAFSNKVMVLKGQRQARSLDDVVDDVFRLRGFGPTDLALALRVAAAQLSTSTAQRRRVILLSDCRPTQGSEPERDVAGLDELWIVAPADDTADAERFASATGARWAALTGPSGVPAAFSSLSD